MNSEEKQNWWVEMDAYWKRYFKIQLNSSFSYDKEARDQFVPNHEQLEELLLSSHLSLYNSSISNFKALIPMRNLVGMDCRIMPFLKDLNDLPQLQSLNSFSLISSKVISFLPLGKMENLISLHLADNNAENLNGLESIQTLQQLEISERKISDISPLAKFPELLELKLSDMEIKNFDMIQQIKSLKKITLEKLNISSLGFLENLHQLENLSCETCNIGATPDIQGLHQLTILNLSNCKVEDPTFLSSLTSLISLDITRTKINALSHLHVLKNLQEIYITEADFSLEEIQAFKKMHPDCFIYSEHGKNFPFSIYEVYELLQDLDLQKVKKGTKVKFTSFMNNSYENSSMYYFSCIDENFNFLWTVQNYENIESKDYFRKVI